MTEEIPDKSLAAEVKDALASCVTALVLTGGAANPQHAERLLQRVLEPFPLPPHHSRTVLRLLRSLYGGSAEQNGRYLEPLQPDLLGEELVAETLPQDQNLLGRILDQGNAEEGSSTLTVLTRLARRRESWIPGALQGRLEQLAEIALDVAVETGDPIGLVLAKEIEDSGSADVVARIQKRCDDEKYRFSVPLREVARVVTEKGYKLLRERRADLDETQQAEFARLANNLGVRLSELGRREEALDATREAVEIYRQLTQLRPDTFRPDLALSLNNLGTSLSELGRREQALDATKEAVEIYRQLVQLRPDTFRPDLASSLNNLGNMLSELGRREQALDATKEAVEIRRQLAQLRPDAFRPDLASSLNNLGTSLSELGRREEAFLVAEEAVRTLSPFFLRFSAAFAPWMATMVRNYRERAEAAGKEPDEALLTPIAEVFQSLSPSQDPED